MVYALVPDDLWERVAPLIPPSPPSPKGGRPRISDRAAFTGIMYVLQTGCAWRYVPRELGGGSGVTCWRRLRDWQQAGVWGHLQQVLLDELGIADRIDWDHACIDSAKVPAKKGAMPRRRSVPIPPTGVSPAPSGI